MTHKHNFIRQTYSRGADGAPKHRLVQCPGCGLSAPNPEHEDLAQQYQAACESIERTRSDPDAAEIMTREGWRLLGQLIIKGELSMAKSDESELAEARAAVLAYNAVLRSAHSIAEREGRETNWDAFLRSVKATLDEHHKTFVSANATRPKPEAKPGEIGGAVTP
jgi:hypothetical protein